MPACVGAKIATGKGVHVDAALIRADVARESLAVRHVDRVAEAISSTEAAPSDDDPSGGGTGTPPPAENTKTAAAERSRRNSTKTGRFRKVCTTDPDAPMATSGRNRRLEPACKQPAVVDKARGILRDVAVTTGEANEGDHLPGGRDRAAELTGGTADMATADAGYALPKVFAGLEERDVTAVIPTGAEPIRSKVPLRRFRHDARHDVPKGPGGKILRPKKAKITHGRFFSSKVRDCKGCDLAAPCLSPSRATGAVVIMHDDPALLRARRCRLCWSEEDDRLCLRHRWRPEGDHGEAKTTPGLARAVRRGLDDMHIQAFLTAAAVKLGRLSVAPPALLGP